MEPVNVVVVVPPTVRVALPRTTEPASLSEPTVVLKLFRLKVAPLRTARLVFTGRELTAPMTIAPDCTLVAPLYALLPFRPRVPVPILVSVRGPVMIPEKVVVRLLLPTLRVALTPRLLSKTPLPASDPTVVAKPLRSTAPTVNTRA